MARMQFTLGTDPEFFLKNKKGQVKSAIPHIKGNKLNPERLPNGGQVQHDNVAVEFATDAAEDVETFITNIRKAMVDVESMLPEDMKLNVMASASFPMEELDNEEALQFGCEPDYDAWTVAENDAPDCVDATLRSCGGHIHVGYKEGSGNEFLLEFDGKIKTVRAMDLFHGIISVILDTSEHSIKRRLLYGKAGAHRPKDYGIEYRSLSNFWLKHPILARLQAHLLDDVLHLIRHDKIDSLIESVGGDTIVNTINSGDVETANKIIKETLIPNMSEGTIALLDRSIDIVAKYTEEETHLHEDWAAIAV